jgi:hypothetical protein
MFDIFHFRRPIDCIFVDRIFVLSLMIFSISFDVLIAVDCFFYVHIYCYSHVCYFLYIWNFIISIVQFRSIVIFIFRLQWMVV